MQQSLICEKCGLHCDASAISVRFGDSVMCRECVIRRQPSPAEVKYIPPTPRMCKADAAAIIAASADNVRAECAEFNSKRARQNKAARRRKERAAHEVKLAPRKPRGDRELNGLLASNSRWENHTM